MWLWRVLGACSLVVVLGHALAAEPSTRPTTLPSRFVLSKDGSEVWCLMGEQYATGGDRRGRALVFHETSGAWEEMPDPKTETCLHDVLYAMDGKTVWAAMTSPEDSDVGVRQRVDSGQWTCLSPPLPPGLHIEELWLTPRGDELWMSGLGHGVFRLRLGTRELSQYVASKGCIATANHFPLLQDSVEALAFTSDGAFAICSASGGGQNSITVIDLKSGLPASYATDSHIYDLVLAPDEHMVWCRSNGQLWGFDLAKRAWTYKFDRSLKEPTAPKDMPTAPDHLLCAGDGEFLWIQEADGRAAVWSFKRQKWTSFVGDDWFGGFAPLCLSHDGQHVLSGHTSGIALMSVSGDVVELLKPSPAATDCRVTQIIPIPDSGDFVCSITHPEFGGVYRIDMAHRRLERIKPLPGLTVTALTICKGEVWFATEDRIERVALAEHASGGIIGGRS